jgi:AraC family transcriptional regulator, melibiose operon regulatory protein
MSPARAVDNTEYLQVGLNSYERKPDLMSRPHRHNEIEFIFIKTGSIEFLFGGSKTTLNSRVLIAFWAGIPHQVLRFPSSTIMIGLEIPVAWFLQWKLPDFLTQSLLGGNLLMESSPAFQLQDARALHRWNVDLSTGREALKRAVLLEIEARFWRFAEGNASALRQKPPMRQNHLVLSDGGLGRVERLAQYISENYTKPIKVENVAKIVDLHPDYAMKIFHKAFGTRLADYLTQHRVFHAQRLLVNTDANIMDIALESGFGSLSRFNANFKEFCGKSPKEYRNAMKPKS